jgi:trimethylamine--corrinoid protein Co-methyltransferase
MTKEKVNNLSFEIMRPRIQLLTLDQISQIHSASLEVLEKTGVNVFLPEAVNLLREGGADVTSESRVRIPSHMVEEALRLAPRSITISDRNGKPAMFLEDNNSYYGTGTDTPFVIDSHSGERRPSEGNDVNNAALIGDYLPNIDFIGCMGGMSMNEVDPLISDRHNFARMVFSTTKPIMFTSWSLAGLSDIYDMAVAVRGGAENFRRSPFMLQYAEPITPLQHPPESLEKLLFCAEKGIPLIYTSSPSMGSTAPVTLAGATVLSNAEFLSGLVIAQIKHEGAPIIYGGASSPMDMRSGKYIYIAPEAKLSHIALKEIASFYGLPNFSTGGCTDSKVFDQQAAIEASQSILLTGLTGSSLIHDVGFMESGFTACLGLIVMADEIIDEVKHFFKGMSVNKETLALGIIDKEGPGGTFLQSEHTLKHFKEIWYPKLINRDTHDKWVRDGSRSLGEVLNERVKWILDNHKAEPLPDEVKGKIEKILEVAGKNQSSAQ